MADIRKADLSPADRDPAEGAPGGNKGGVPMPPPAIQESHLGRGGDPAEGRTDVQDQGPKPRSK